MTQTCAYREAIPPSTVRYIYKNLESQHAVIKQQKLCYNCLPRQCAFQCASKNHCRKCGSKHHTSICNNSILAVENQHQQKSDPTTAATLTAFVPPQMNRNIVCLLKTAIAMVVGNGSQAEENVLFDEGSQRSFLTEKLTTMLVVTPQRSETFNLSSYDSSQPLYRQIESVIVHIKTQSKDLVPVSAPVVPTIPAPLANITNSSISKLLHLKGLPLAHPVSIDKNFKLS